MGRKRKVPNKIDPLESYKRIRKTWEINPKTRVKDSNKKYKRTKAKANFRRELRNQDLTT